MTDSGATSGYSNIELPYEWIDLNGLEENHNSHSPPYSRLPPFSASPSSPSSLSYPPQRAISPLSSSSSPTTTAYPTTATLTLPTAVSTTTNFQNVPTLSNFLVPGFSTSPNSSPFPSSALSPSNFLFGVQVSPQINDCSIGYFPRVDCKPDSFHQTIQIDEINLKEQKRAEEAFAIENEWSRFTARSEGDFVAMLTPTGLIIRVSENSKEVLGLRPDQIVGVNLTNFIHINELSSVYDQLNLVVNAGRTAIMVHQFKIGTAYIDLESTFFPFFPQLSGDSRYVMLRSKRFKPLSQENPNPSSETTLHKKFISRMTLEGVFTYVSPSISNILGYSSQEVLGRSSYEFFHPDDFLKLSETYGLLKSFKSSKPVTVEHRFRRKNGSFATIQTSFNIFLNPVNGNPECILCTSSDCSKPIQPDPIEISLLEKLRAEVQELKNLLLERTLEIEKLRQEKEFVPENSEKKKRKRKIRTDLQCEQCGTTTSPEWRKGPSGNQSLCNACGLRYAKKTKGVNGNESAFDGMANNIESGHLLTNPENALDA